MAAGGRGPLGIECRERQRARPRRSRSKVATRAPRSTKTKRGRPSLPPASHPSSNGSINGSPEGQNPVRVSIASTRARASSASDPDSGRCPRPPRPARSRRGARGADPPAPAAPGSARSTSATWSAIESSGSVSSTDRSAGAVDTSRLSPSTAMAGLRTLKSSSLSRSTTSAVERRRSIRGPRRAGARRRAAPAGGRRPSNLTGVETWWASSARLRHASRHPAAVRAASGRRRWSRQPMSLASPPPPGAAASSPDRPPPSSSRRAGGDARPLRGRARRPEPRCARASSRGVSASIALWSQDRLVERPLQQGLDRRRRVCLRKGVVGGRAQAPARPVLPVAARSAAVASGSAARAAARQRHPTICRRSSRRRTSWTRAATSWCRTPLGVHGARSARRRAPRPGRCGVQCRSNGGRPRTGRQHRGDVAERRCSRSRSCCTSSVTQPPGAARACEPRGRPPVRRAGPRR